jgi:V8-like Glu-specific endopeptidase
MPVRLQETEMSTGRISTAVVLVVCGFLIGCDEGPDLPVETETAYRPIIGGTPDSGHPAVGAVVMNYFLCTGTLVSPRIVVTAAHCILPGDPPKQFGLGPKTGSVTEILNVSQAIAHPQYGQSNVEGWTVNINDIAVLVLATSAQAAPMKFRTASLNGLQGSAITFVGFGVTQPGNSATTGTKMKVASTIGQIATQGFFNFTSPSNPKNTCTGDSGGPAIYNNGGTEELIGVVSGGDVGCVENGFNTRVDIHSDWILGLIQQYDPQGTTPVCGNGACETGESSANCPGDCGGSDSCQGIIYQGCCEGETVKWCDDGQLKVVDCTAVGKPKCGWNASISVYDCGTDGGTDPSGAYLKACGGTTSPVCGNGTCENGESEVSCPADCTTGPVCGNGTCESGETSASCAADCYVAPVCGNGTCEPGETAAGCPVDCAMVTCGDGKCEAPETSESCPVDCDMSTPSNCGDGDCTGSESEGTCPADCAVESCGNGSCAPHETCFLCPSDCGSCEEGGGGGCGIGCRSHDLSGLILFFLVLFGLCIFVFRDAPEGRP